MLSCKNTRRTAIMLGVVSVFLASSTRPVAADIGTLSQVKQAVDAKGAAMEKTIALCDPMVRGERLVEGLREAIQPFMDAGDLTSTGMTVAGQSADAITVYIWIGFPGGRHMDFVYEMLLEF